MKNKNKWLILLTIVCALSLALFTGCVDTSKVEDSSTKVQSLYLQYNGAKVDGEFESDLSSGTVKLDAVVTKGDNCQLTPTFTSGDQTIATIDNDGLVTLLKVGESIITCTCGDKTYQFVLTVKGATSQTTTYAITVDGGKAYNAKGEVITKAEKGQYINLVYDEIAHKDFIKWNFSVEENVWKNGNSFKMPDSDLTVTAEFEDILYKLNAVGCVVTKAGTRKNPEGTETGHTNSLTTSEDIKTEYAFAYDTPITIKIFDDTDYPYADTNMFVGFDYNATNNRVGDEGVGEYTFNMSDEIVTITAIFSQMNKNYLALAKFSTTKQDGVTATRYDSTNPATGEGLDNGTGFEFQIKGNVTGNTSFGENITVTADANNLDSYTNFEAKTVRIICKNRSDKYDLKVELYVSYFDNMAKSGVITVPKGKIVETIMHVNVGIPNNSSWGFMVREDVGGLETDIVPLDVVVIGADTYPTGYLLVNTTDTPDYMTFSSTSPTVVGVDNGRRVTRNNIGGFFWSCRNSAVKDGNYMTVKVKNLPEYDENNPTTTVYVKVMNLVSLTATPLNEYHIGFIKGSNNPYNESAVSLADTTVSITQVGEVLLYKIVIPRTASDGDIYLSITKPTVESGQSVNVLMQFAYNNVFGYQEK